MQFEEISFLNRYIHAKSSDLIRTDNLYYLFVMLEKLPTQNQSVDLNQDRRIGTATISSYLNKLKYPLPVTHYSFVDELALLIQDKLSPDH